MPLTKQDDGTYKTLLGKTVTAKEFAELEKFKQDFVNDARKKVAEEKMAKRKAELAAEQAEQAKPNISNVSEDVAEKAVVSDATEAASDKSIEMLEIEENNNDVSFNYFEGKWDVMKGNVVVAQGVSKMGAIDKAIEEPASTKTVVIKGNNNKDNTYVVEGDIIKNSKGKEVYSKPSKMREKIMSQEATNDLTLFNDTADLLVDPDISKEEMNAFLTEEGAPVSEERLRYLVAMQATGKKLSTNEYMMLDSKSSRIEASKMSDVSQSNDTKISKQDKKAVPLPSSGRKKIKSNSLFGKRKIVKKAAPSKTTKEDVKGAQDQGNEDTKC
jgi:hypothetical protein